MYPNESEKLVVKPRGDQEVRYRLLLSPESVVEVLVGHNRTLIDEGTTIGIIGTPLEQTVPMLKRISVLLTHSLETLTIDVTTSIDSSVSLSMTLIANPSP
jgi:hypothetical protein